MCPACSIRQKLLLSSTPLGALAMAVTSPAQILTHATEEWLFQTALPLLCPPGGYFRGEPSAPLYSSCGFVPQGQLPISVESEFFFCGQIRKWTQRMETGWDESRICPNSSGLKEAAAWGDSGGREQEREGELERGDSRGYRRVRTEH